MAVGWESGIAGGGAGGTGRRGARRARLGERMRSGAGGADMPTGSRSGEKGREASGAGPADALFRQTLLASARSLSEVLPLANSTCRGRCRVGQGVVAFRYEMAEWAGVVWPCSVTRTVLRDLAENGSGGRLAGGARRRAEGLGRVGGVGYASAGRGGIGAKRGRDLSVRAQLSATRGWFREEASRMGRDQSGGELNGQWRRELEAREVREERKRA